jgi:hypothetical protein
MLALVVQNHPDCAAPDFRWEFVRRLACHGFSRLGASGNPSAVQTGPMLLALCVQTFREKREALELWAVILRNTAMS